jgi:hypothetical protein
VEQNTLTTNVEKCDCLGECGYGPNVMRIIQANDDNASTEKTLINQMRGKDSIYQALGLPLPTETTSSEKE